MNVQSSRSHAIFTIHVCQMRVCTQPDLVRSPGAQEPVCQGHRRRATRGGGCESAASRRGSEARLCHCGFFFSFFLSFSYLCVVGVTLPLSLRAK